MIDQRPGNRAHAPLRDHLEANQNIQAQQVNLADALQQDEQLLRAQELVQNCAKEDLRYTARVQSFVYLLVIDSRGEVVVACSANCAKLLGTTTEQIIGESPVALFGPEFLTYIQEAQVAVPGRNTSVKSLSVLEKRFHLTLTLEKDFWLAEIEPVHERFVTESEIFQVINRPLRRVTASSMSSVIEDYATRFAEIAKFDRVMVYQFLDDWSGKVVCEVANNYDKSFLGLHFPASDIPENARALYEKYPSRLINDVTAESQQLITISGLNPEDIDLGNVRGRSCSEVHLMYLKNMNVRSSYSCSIMCRNKLWGLIACHNKSPLNLDLMTRLDCEKISRALSMEIMRIQAERKLQMIENFKSGAAALIEKIPDHLNLEGSFLAASAELTDLMEADGVAVVNSAGIMCSGSTPRLSEIENILEIISARSEQRIYYTNSIAQIYPSAREYSTQAAGVFAASTGILSQREETDVLFLWFRKDFAETVSWAGKPEKDSTAPLFRLKSGLNVLSPRVSFEIWKQERLHSCRPWNNEHVFKANLWIHSYAKKNHLGFDHESAMLND